VLPLDPDVPAPPPVVAVPELLLGLTPPVVGPLVAELDEPPDDAVLLEEELDDPLVAGVEELVVGVVPVEDAAL
jgi:hypothetical protein